MYGIFVFSLFFMNTKHYSQSSFICVYLKLISQSNFKLIQSISFLIDAKHKYILTSEKASLMSEKVKACEFCGEQSATVLCAECCRCYCDRCGKFAHGIDSMKGHKTEVIPESVIVDGMCPLHNDIPLKMFFVDEVKLCCGIWKVKKLHKGHNVVDLSEVSQDNETFSASEVRKHFADVLKCDDE